MQTRLLSISEITTLEEAFHLGPDSLGAALSALEDRWREGVRDPETTLRLLFLRWYAGVEPAQYTGLPLDGPTPAELVDELGGVEKLAPEARFCLGYMAHFFPWAVGETERWQKSSPKLFDSAADAAPDSKLFAEWPYFVGRADDTEELRTRLRQEIHARFDGRGEFGRYFGDVLSAQLEPV